MAMPNMGKMIGPLPMGAWIIVVGGGIGIMVYTQRNSAATATAPAVTDPGTGTGVSGMWTDVTPPATSSNNAAGAPTTNDEWGVRAINYLIAMGYPAANADQAIRKYLATSGLGVSEVAMVTAALLALGSTPQVLPPPTISVPGPSAPPSTPPVPKPAAKPYTYHTVTITQTLPSIAMSYRKSVIDLWDANKIGIKRLDGSGGFLTSYALHHGQVLVIPWVKPVHL